ncbi:mechanosensitive channel MscK [Ectopseudomonas mendocina]|uniref:Mechanosensitive channel MscK n=1 Tax=Ectopseudomonas mendocina TaxID=300 RepID=A0ABZ2RE27_ECTME
MTSLRFLLPCLLLSLALNAFTAQAAEIPKAENIQSSLDQLAERKLPEAEQAAAKQALEKTLALLTERDDILKRLSALEEQLSKAPSQIREAQRELEQLQSTKPVNVRQQFADSSLASLELRLAERNAQLGDWQQLLIEANSQLISSKTRPERTQTELSNDQARSQAIMVSLKTERDAGKPLTRERRDQLLAELAMLEAKTRVSRQELAGNTQLQDLSNSRRALLEERIARVLVELQDLQSLINDKRHDISEQTLAEQSDEVKKAGKDNLLAQESSRNLKLSDQLLQVTERLNRLTHKNLETKQQLDNLSQSDQALEEQINVLQGSLLLSRILYTQQLSLPQLRLDGNLTEQIADLRLNQFELGQHREEISNPEQYVDKLLAKSGDEAVSQNNELRDKLIVIINSRLELIDQLNRELNALLNESITLQLNQKQLQNTADTLRKTLDEQMFWIPSNKPLDLEWLKSAPHRLEQQFMEMPWGANIQQLISGLTSRPLIFLPLLLLIGLLLWKRTYLQRKLDELHQDIGHYKNDSQLHTPLAITLNLLLALPGTLFLALCGYALELDAQGQNANLSLAFYQMAEAWLLFYTLYRILCPSGVAELHFRWARPNVAYLQRYVKLLGLVVLAMVAVVSIAEHQPAMLADDVIGIAIMLIGLALMTWLMGRLLLAGPLREHGTRITLLVGFAFTATPVILIFAIGFGYYYTSLKLTDRLIDTLYLLIIWLILDSGFARGLAVAARRLAYQRVLAKRQAQIKEAEDGTEIPAEEPKLDIEQINQQSQRMIRLALLGCFIGALYLIWADLLSVLTYLDGFVLYEYTSGAGAEVSMVPMSVLDVLGALLVSAITIIMARNLPGLLEVLVLSRMSLAQGSAYATTTLLSYAIAGLGIASTLSILGVSWDKLQWLVAALSVGIGFGMQAIFANFISGLILLFERPIRIGDTVTIGTVTGTVNRIHIRATHITDSDRKAVVVPNQILLTSQLINWTLTDTVTRVVLTFSVSRGADLDQVKELLLQAAQENSRVLREPAPSAQLTLYGSSQNFELKIYVRELGDRSLATDELNRRIDQLFSENGINLSSPSKVEVTLANNQGQTHKLEEFIEQQAENRT